MDASVREILSLAEWRRTVSELYADVRADVDPEHGWQRWCDERRALFSSHEQSPIPAVDRPGYEGPNVFDYDPAARVTAELIELEPQRIEVGTSDGSSTRFLRFARAAFSLYGQDGSLDVFWLDAYGGGLYLPFRDLTSGATTYGGGRYLLDSVKGADLGAVQDRPILDFNFAYNPSCSYDARWSCPLPPPSNRLPIEVPAGERLG